MTRAFAMVILFLMTSSATAPAPVYSLERAPFFDGDLSVLTYNVKGLPWPIASGRRRALREIGERLRVMTKAKQRPAIVVLQEVFTEDARHIADIAGYRYRAAGPGVRQTPVAAIPAGPFRRQWIKGEGIGKFIGSGLLVLSDFPIRWVQSMAFPEGACAGYDCLANKGVVLVEIDLPDVDTPLLVATTHMNSKRHSGVSVERGLAAYAKQVDAMRRFLAAHRDPRTPMIFAGDFNVGRLPQRAAILFERPWIASPDNDGLRTLARARAREPRADARAAIDAAADWQFFASGSEIELRPISANVPFPSRIGGKMLSDHIGYMVTYRLEQRPEARATL